MNNKFNRRNFLGTASLTTGAFALSSFTGDSQYDLPSSIERLQPMTANVVPISVEERKQRIAKAQELMQQQKVDAIFMEGTVSAMYFTEVQTKDVQYKPFITEKDPPAIHLNKGIMDQYKDQLKKYYYDPSKYSTYLEQLGITYPTVNK